jgi:hypothetical protein
MKNLSVKGAKRDEKKNVKVELADVNLLVCCSRECVGVTADVHRSRNSI